MFRKFTKRFSFLFAILLSIAIFFIIDANKNSNSVTEQKADAQTLNSIASSASTTKLPEIKQFFDIYKILSKSEKEVNEILGDPNSSTPVNTGEIDGNAYAFKENTYLDGRVLIAFDTDSVYMVTLFLTKEEYFTGDLINQNLRYFGMEPYDLTMHHDDDWILRDFRGMQEIVVSNDNIEDKKYSGWIFVQVHPLGHSKDGKYKPVN
ncbi:hypothetical protein [Brevibacillus sp. SYSU BS000544]|uniref:hypothetical protein n=1 Tax=Brevibacillus sp. SYSU BS000544 TaxID=3416443 RepID=UPI003CE4F9D6